MLTTGSTAKVRSAWRKVGTLPPILPTYLSHATRTAAAGDTPTLHHCWELSQPRAFLDGPLAPLLRTPPTSRHFLRTMDILSHCRQHEFRMSSRFKGPTPHLCQPSSRPVHADIFCICPPLGTLWVHWRPHQHVVPFFLMWSLPKPLSAQNKLHLRLSHGLQHALLNQRLNILVPEFFDVHLRHSCSHSTALSGPTAISMRWYKFSRTSIGRYLFVTLAATSVAEDKWQSRTYRNTALELHRQKA